MGRLTYTDRGAHVILHDENDYVLARASTVMLQGDDYLQIMEEIERLEAVWEEHGWDTGPDPDKFPTFEDHLSAVLEDYFHGF